MNCVLVTLTYPYGNGDPFLHEEIPVITKEFEHIYIIPMIKEEGGSDRLPDNVELVSWKENKYKALIQTAGRFARIIKEVVFGRKMGYGNLARMFHRAFLYEYKYHMAIDAIRQFNGPEFIFYSYWLSEPAYLLARYKMENPGIMCVSRAHGYDCFKDRGYNPYRREIACNIDCIYSISEQGKKDLEENLACLADDDHKPKIKVAHLGVCTGEDINPLYEYRDPFRIVSCSNVIQLKRLDLLAEAVRQVNCRDKRLEWIHFGDGELLQDIKDQIKSYGALKNKEIDFKGATAHDKILQYYQTTHVDLFVNCSDAEGIPVSIMEAMEYGIPCLGRDVGGVSELIDDKKNGYLLPRLVDSQMIASVIEKLMEQGISQDMRNRAKEKILADFSNVKNYHKFAQELIARK